VNNTAEQMTMLFNSVLTSTFNPYNWRPLQSVCPVTRAAATSATILLVGIVSLVIFWPLFSMTFTIPDRSSRLAMSATFPLPYASPLRSRSNLSL
jgi:threonine/homoserine/homoserine lactone efflux protein